MKKLYILGFQGQGKGLLRVLLDGHPEIFNPGFICCPGISLLQYDFIHRILPRIEEMRVGKTDRTYQYFSRGDLRIKVNGKFHSVSIGDIWNQLFKKGFYNLLIDVSFADWSNLNIGKANVNDLVGDFNFVEFLNDAIQDIVRKKDFESIEQLQETIYMSFIKHYKTPANAYFDESYFLQISLQNGFDVIKDVSRNNVNKKILVLDRDPVSHVFGNTMRLVDRNPKIMKCSKSMYERILFSDFESILFSKVQINKYKSYRKNLDALRQKEKCIYLVNFNEMILNTEKTMNNIANYLGINPHPIMYKATLNGVPIEDKDGYFVTGKILHDPYEVLSKKQINMLNYLFNGWDSNLSLLQNFYLFFIKIKLNLWYSKYYRKFVRVVIRVLRFPKNKRKSFVQSA